MDLFLVQHGEAKSEAEDPERSLTDRGAEAVRRMAAWAAQVARQLEIRVWSRRIRLTREVRHVHAVVPSG